MLPSSLFNAYDEYKKDTNSIAAWLASTAKAAGYPMGNDGDGPVDAPPGCSTRLKGKARVQGKKEAAAAAAAASKEAKEKAREDKSTKSGPKYIITTQQFTRLASFVSDKHIAVPVSFKNTLNRVIAARSKFQESFRNYADEVNEEEDRKHERFIQGKFHGCLLATLAFRAGEFH